MPTYRYRAVDPNGEPVEATIEEASARRVALTLEERGYQVSQVEAVEEKRPWFPRGPLTWDDLAFLNEQLAYITRSGLPLGPAIQALSEDVRNPRLQPVLVEVQDALEGGMALSDALEVHRAKLPPFYVSLVQAGEKAGNMAAVLDAMTQHARTMACAVNRLHIIMIYPAILVAAGTGLIALLAIAVAPEMAAALGDMEADVPAATRMWAGFGEWLQRHGVGVLLVVALAAVTGKLALNRARDRTVIENAKERLLRWIPVVARIRREGALTRFTETLALMVRAGVPLPDSVELAARASGSPWLRRAGLRAREAIEQGTPLADALSGSQPLPAQANGATPPHPPPPDAMPGSKTFPALYIWSLRAAEDQGGLEQGLAQLAADQRQQFGAYLERAQVYLLPMIIIVLGFILGIALVGIYYPIWNLSDLYV